MSNEEEKGQGKQIKGRLREAAGALTGDREMKAKGKIEQTEGKARETIGRTKRKLTENDYEDEDL